MTIRQKIQAYNQYVTNWLAGSKPKNQIPALDGLRAIACLTVLAFHLNLLARTHGIWPRFYSANKFIAIPAYFGESLAYFGESGVILFFLLSSFLLFLPYAKSLLFDSPWPSLHRFYLRRIFRILPGYYAAVLLIAWLFQPAILNYSHRHDLWLFLTFQMDPVLSEQLNGPFWTLAIEFQFYLLLPILAWLFSLIVRQGTLRWRMLKLTSCLLIMVAWGLFTRALGLSTANPTIDNSSLLYRVFTTLKPSIYGVGSTISSGKFLEVFAVGMLICMVYTYTQYAPLAEPCSTMIHRLSPLIFAMGLALLALLAIWHSIVYNYAAYNLIFTILNSYSSTIMSYWLEWEAMGHAISYGLCLLALLYGSSRLKRAFEWSILRQIGFISFSIYLWHLPILVLLVTLIYRQQGRGPLVQYGEFWYWTLVVILPLCVLLYRGIEVPGIYIGELLIRKLNGEKKPRAVG